MFVFGYIHLSSSGEIFLCWFVCACVRASRMRNILIVLSCTIVDLAACRSLLCRQLGGEGGEGGKPFAKLCTCLLITGGRKAEGLCPLEHELPALAVLVGGHRHGAAGGRLRDLGRGATCIHRVDHKMHGSCSLLLNDIAARRF